MNTLENTCFQFKENDEASKECIIFMNVKYPDKDRDDYIGISKAFYFIEKDKRKNVFGIDETMSRNLISPSDYLALLTAKLSEADSIAGAGVIAARIIDNLEPKYSAIEQAMFIAGFQEAVKYFKLLPVQEIMKKESEHAQDAIDLVTTRVAKELGYKNILSAVHARVKPTSSFTVSELFYICMTEYSNQQTTSLQQQLKEANEKIQKFQFMIDNGLGWQDMVNDI